MLGWLDGSNALKNEFLNSIRKDQKDIDELGLNPIKKALADHFFPCTTTLQVRAKYYLIVPYAMRDIEKDSSLTPKKILNECAQKLKERNTKKVNSIIGANVNRSPDVIYKSGIEKLGIVGHPELPYEDNWKDSLKIGLTEKEADFLSNRIKETYPNSLMAHLLDLNIDLPEKFGDLSKFVTDPELKKETELAAGFSDFCEILLKAYGSLDAPEKFKLSFGPAEADKLDLEGLLSIKGVKADDELVAFLNKAKELVEKRDSDGLKDLVNERAETLGKFKKDKKWDFGKPNFRYNNARNILSDIRKKEELGV